MLIKKTILACLLLVVIVGCGGSKTLTASNGLYDGKDKAIESVNKTIKAPITATEEKDILDRVLSTPILFLFAVSAVLCILGVVVCIYMKRMGMAIGCACGAVMLGILPVIIVVFFKAMIILLYVFAGLIIICGGLGLWWLWRKIDMNLDAEEEELNESK